MVHYQCRTGEQVSHYLTKWPRHQAGHLLCIDGLEERLLQEDAKALWDKYGPPTILTTSGIMVPSGYTELVINNGCQNAIWFKTLDTRQKRKGVVRGQ